MWIDKYDDLKGERRILLLLTIFDPFFRTCFRRGGGTGEEEEGEKGVALRYGAGRDEIRFFPGKFKIP